jgi:hypothetical protein
MIRSYSFFVYSFYILLSIFVRVISKIRSPVCEGTVCRIVQALSVGYIYMLEGEILGRLKGSDHYWVHW